MKKLIVTLLALALFLSGCGCSKKPAETEPTTAPTTAPTQAPTQAPTVAPTVAPTEPPATVAPQEPKRHPLTGEMLEEDWSGQIAAVMVNNVKAALPQYGLSQAEVIYEIEEEGGATRNMALFSDVSKIGKIGSIRSTRTYFVSIAAAYDAYLVHCGTSVHAENGGYDHNGNKVPDWKDIDQQYSTFAEYFYRDQDRNAAGYAWEHTLFTTGELLASAMEGKDLSNPKTGFIFKEGSDLATGVAANELTITFNGGKTTSFIYDAETGLYARTQFNAESFDGGTEETETVKNVIAMYTNQWYCPERHGHQYYDTIGSGEGYAAVNGKVVPIKWSRATTEDPFIYTLEDGTALELDVGRSYIAIVGTKHPFQYK